MHKLLLALVAFVSLWFSEIATPQAPPRQRMMATGYYLREPTDREWHIRVVGEVPSFAGMYMIVHDQKGRLLHRGTIDHGKYSVENPLVITIPKDGMTGDYRVHLVGQQDDFLGLHLPLSDLPFEVYTGTFLSLGHDKNVLAFTPPAGVTQMAMGAYSGHLQVLDEKKEILADTRKGGKGGKAEDPNSKYFDASFNYIEFPVEPARIYWLSPAETMYFKPRERVYFAFDPQRLFVPMASELDAVPYWELANQKAKN